MITKEYDNLFEFHGGKWLPEWDWRYLKSVAYALSMLQPEYASPDGRIGLMGLTRDQWNDSVARLRFPGGAIPTDPVRSIEAGTYYLAVMRGGWGAERSETTRRELALASYYIGFDTVKSAKDRAVYIVAEEEWSMVEHELIELIGRKAHDALVNFIKRVEETYQQLKKHEIN